MIKNNLFKSAIKKYSNFHKNEGKKDIMVFSTPRSGSTWLMELIWSQPGFKYCNEPLNLRNPLVIKNTGLTQWNQLYDHTYTNQILTYFKKISEGSIKDLNPNPFNKFYKFKTNRIVFKILDGMEDRVLTLASYCNAIPLLLIRHPIAVSVSRQLLPRIETHFQKDFTRNIPAHIIKEARQIVDTGNFLQQAIVCWCFENYYQLKEIDSNKYKGVTYEEMVVDPKAAVARLAPYLDLGNEELILENIKKPSKTTNKSDVQTKEIMHKEYSPELILNKWKKKVSDKDIANTQHILGLFEIDMYKAGEAMPVKNFR